MEATITVGELRDLLAGLRCPEMHALPVPDAVPARVSTAVARQGGDLHYVLAVEIAAPRRGRRR